VSLFHLPLRLGTNGQERITGGKKWLRLCHDSIFRYAWEPMDEKEQQVKNWWLQLCLVSSFITPGNQWTKKGN
jgi:hypothetical protein